VAAHHHLRARVSQGVEDGIDLGAWHTEYVLDTVRGQGLHHPLRASRRLR